MGPAMGVPRKGPLAVGCKKRKSTFLPEGAQGRLPGGILPSRMLRGGDFPAGPVVKTLSSQCRGPRFNPWSGN